MYNIKYMCVKRKKRIYFRNIGLKDCFFDFVRLIIIEAFERAHRIVLMRYKI